MCSLAVSVQVSRPTRVIKVVFSDVSKGDFLTGEVLVEGVLADHNHSLVGGIDLLQRLHDLPTDRCLSRGSSASHSDQERTSRREGSRSTIDGSSVWAHS